MRRAATAGSLAAAILLGTPAFPAHAAAAAKPATVCTISDQRLSELSGLAVTGKGYLAINDGSDDARRRRIFTLTSRCAVSRTVAYPSRPRDTEDLALAPDGTLWVADIGDNGRSRETVGLWKLAPGAARPVLHRFTYPDGPHDAEALLLNGDGTPIIVTKDPFTAGLYVAATTPRAKATTALRKAGSFRIPDTSTSNPFGIAGRLVLTGGATAPDGTKVALRTYADAFEFRVTGGDVITAVTTGKAVTTALPDEPQGESLAYSADGASLLTVSETAGAPAGSKPTISRYASGLPDANSSPSPATTSPAISGSPPSPGSPAGAAAPKRTSTATEITAAGIGVTGALVLALITIVLTRRRRRA